MIDVALAAAGWAVVGWLPGLLLLEALRPGAALIRNLALAPLGSVGLVMLAGQLLYVLGRPVSAAPVLALSVGVPLILWLAVRRSAARAEARVRLATRADIAFLVAAMIAGVAIWWMGISGSSDALPNNDGAHHGLYASRIARFATLKPSVVLAGDGPTGRPTSHYYPLGMHLQAAVISRLTGIDVNAVLTVGLVIASAVALPVGMFLLTRRLFAETPLAAGVAALIATSFPWFPHAPIAWGGVPLIVAMSQVPAGIDAVCSRRRDGRPIFVGIALGIGAYGLFEEHNTELVTVGIFGVILAVAARRQEEDERSTWNHLTTAWATGAVLFAVLVGPQLLELRRGAAEAGAYLGAGIVAVKPNASVTPLQWILIVGNPVVLVLGLLGIAISVRRRYGGWLGCAGVSLVLWLVTQLNVPGLKRLTVPWYSNSVRLSYLFAYFEVTFGALGAVVIGQWLVRRLAHGDAIRPAIARSLVAGAAAVVGITGVGVASLALVRQGYHDGSLVGSAQRAGFSWLARHTAPQARVLNQSTDGSGWMETLDGVHPLFATKADTRPADPQRVWGDRWYLLTHAADLAVDRRAQAAVRTWNVAYVYVNDRVFPGQRALLSSQRLASSPAYRQVWHRGDVTIFAVRLP